MKYLRPMLLAMLVLGAGLLWAADRRDQLREQRRHLELQLAETRQRLLTEDDELRELHDRIRSLQVVLARKLDARPEMAKLEAELAAVDKELAAAADN